MYAEAYLPKDDSVVLLELKNQDELKKIKKLEKAFKASSDNQDLANLISQKYIKLFRKENKPKYLSYAQTVLDKWWQGDAAKEIILSRAYIKQYNHKFKEALKDLDLYLTKVSTDDQAHLIKSAIYNELQDFSNAKKECQSLTKSDLKEICLLNAGELGLYAKLTNLEIKDAEIKTWFLTSLALAAQKLDKASEAQDFYKKALANDDNDIYLLKSYAGFLLEKKRYQEVVTLLENKTQNDYLLLRLAIAEKQLKHKKADEHIKQIKETIAIAKQLNEEVHSQELELLSFLD